MPRNRKAFVEVVGWRKISIVRPRPYDSRVTRHHLPLLLLSLALTACGSDPAPTPADAARDVALDAASDTSTDVTPDTSDVPADEFTPDAPADVQPDVADVASDAPSTDAAEVGSDVARDVSPDTGTDAGSDVSPDVGVRCPANGVTRCNGDAIEICEGNIWRASACPLAEPALGTRYACSADTCTVCRVDITAPTRCSVEPFCATNSDCYARGFGRCIDGRCATIGRTSCVGDIDCVGWGAPDGPIHCDARSTTSPFTGICAAARAQPCRADAMCPTTHTCNAVTGLCERR